MCSHILMVPHGPSRLDSRRVIEMNIRQIVGALLVVLTLSCVALTASGPHSNFVPGDFIPAAEALGINIENGYYDLGHMLDVLVRRVVSLEATVGTQSAQLEMLSQAIESLSIQLATQEEPLAEFDITWVNQTQWLQRNHEITLVFETLPGAICALEVFYEGTGSYSTSPRVRTSRTADARGVVQWTWELTAKSGQDARITLSATAPDGRQGSQCWTSAVID